MRNSFRRVFCVTGLAGWAALVAFGATQLWKYESAAGAPAHSPIRWPGDAKIARRPGLPTLVLLVHPHCPCSRATIGELAELMTHCQGKLTTAVLMLHPQGMSEEWVHTDLWTDAAAIPGVSVVEDNDGAQAQRFGASTSGQSLLYSTDGRLIFAGGITESRGHSGDNAGRSAIEELVLDSSVSHVQKLAATPVYGCPLFKPGECLVGGSTSCKR